MNDSIYQHINFSSQRNIQGMMILDLWYNEVGYLLISDELDGDYFIKINELSLSNKNTWFTSQSFLISDSY